MEIRNTITIVMLFLTNSSVGSLPYYFSANILDADACLSRLSRINEQCFVIYTGLTQTHSDLPESHLSDGIFLSGVVTGIKFSLLKTL